jgi:hypothetical protein
MRPCELVEVIVFVAAVYVELAAGRVPKVTESVNDVSERGSTGLESATLLYMLPVEASPEGVFADHDDTYDGLLILTRGSADPDETYDALSMLKRGSEVTN